LDWAGKGGNGWAFSYAFLIAFSNFFFLSPTAC
jgi:hypothetical protein